MAEGWFCPRDHYQRATYTEGPEPMVHPTFGDWAICQVQHHEKLWRFLIDKVGVLDADHDGGLVYWRWDFWNSNMKALIAKLEREEWERKRRQAIARWGEGAG